jgi:hypothetical protein
MNGPYEFFGMCQCSRCRKVTGAAFATNLFVKPEQFIWLSGENNRGEFALPSPNTFGNAFCHNLVHEFQDRLHEDGCYFLWEALSNHPV